MPNDARDELQITEQIAALERDVLELLAVDGHASVGAVGLEQHRFCGDTNGFPDSADSRQIVSSMAPHCWHATPMWTCSSILKPGAVTVTV
jgi:hypothetical protein